ncbi:glutathione S-transferase 1-1-like isoform X2 [Athalia rosae]|uniref:glutathione S-transferase 1-1-like isoform X2 n=1 Tax=Athalia rosae TaxID=37344 RepID=UPI00203362BA|nr:glutathione S-transferase 1-1-like isoform X2 [Athalia rosae]
MIRNSLRKNHKLKFKQNKETDMPVDFYCAPASIPCRSVMMLAKAIGIHLNLKTLNLSKGEHLKSGFEKINPQHTIPTINDNGFILWESRAILGYFVERYAKDDSYYPKSPEERGRVDQRLYFDLAILNYNLLKAYLDVITGKSNKVNEEGVAGLEKAFELLDAFLNEQDYVAGDNLTIADFSIISTISTADEVGFDIRRYDNVMEWYQRCQKDLSDFGYEQIDSAGAKILGNLFKKNLLVQ